jgi:hypothetical protein
MITVTAKPTWQVSSKNIPALSLGSRSGSAGTSVLKQILLPRSLDLSASFAMKYRR